MHKASIALIVSGVLLVLGISVVLAGLKMGGSMNFTANPLTQTVETVGEDNVQGQGTVDAFDKIHLEFDVGNVTIEEGSDYYVEYDLPKKEVPEIRVEVPLFGGAVAGRDPPGPAGAATRRGGL